MKINLLIILSLLAVAGCTMPLRPGRSNFASASGVTGYVQQSQNPQQSATQTYERTQETLSPGVPVVPNTPIRTTERVTTVIGAAQKDTAREMGAKLASLRPVMWVGILVFLFGAATFVYPPLKLIVGASVTTSAVITAAGLAMIVLPSLIVGHELLILAVAGGAASFWFFAHRHGSVHAELKSIKAGFIKV